MAANPYKKEQRIAKQITDRWALEALAQQIEVYRTEENSPLVNQLQERLKTWTPKQLRARLSQTAEATEWQAKHGNPAYREANQADLKMYQFILGHLEQLIWSS